jgi:hypothetical protein
MNVELVAQMFKNYQSNVLFHLEGKANLLGLKQLLLMFPKLRTVSKIPHDVLTNSGIHGSGLGRWRFVMNRALIMNE